MQDARRWRRDEPKPHELSLPFPKMGVGVFSFDRNSRKLDRFRWSLESMLPLFWICTGSDIPKIGFIEER